MGVDLEVSAEISEHLPDGGQEYLEALASRLDDDVVVSIVLFGSVVSGETTSISDVDLIVILDSNVSEDDVRAVEQRCADLAATYLDAGTDTPTLFEHYLERATGMFRSGFVTTEAAVRRGEFPNIFRTSPIASVVAPWRTVLYTTLEEGVTIYGPPVDTRWEQVGTPMERPYRELARSLVMTVALALAQVGYQFVSRRAIGYSLEAAKWTAYNCAFHRRGRTAGSLTRALSTVSFPSWYRTWFVHLRDDPCPDRWFVLATPLVLVWAHVHTALHVARPDPSE